LAPDCSRIELATLPEKRDELKLLQAMGSETANVHLGTAGAAPRIVRHLNRQKNDWFTSAVEQMTESVKEDWRAWKKAKS
jgi:endonuclease III